MLLFKPTLFDQYNTGPLEVKIINNAINKKGSEKKIISINDKIISIHRLVIKINKFINSSSCSKTF